MIPSLTQQQLAPLIASSTLNPPLGFYGTTFSVLDDALSFCIGPSPLPLPSSFLCLHYLSYFVQFYIPSLCR